jgi:hypothetical protein
VVHPVPTELIDQERGRHGQVGAAEIARCVAAEQERNDFQLPVGERAIPTRHNLGGSRLNGHGFDAHESRC